MADPDLCPGAPVVLHSLIGKPELNGARGKCQEFIAETGRWAVLLDGKGTKGMKVKPANLRRLFDRAQAASTLCNFLSELHPDKGFLLHPSIKFEEAAGDVSVKATAKMEKGEILLVMPESAMIAVSSAECKAIHLDGGNRTMGTVLASIDEAFHAQFDGGLPMLESHNVSLAVLLMHVACQPESESLYEKIANTWPPLEAAKGLPINWDAAQIDRVKGTSLPDAVKQLQADASEAFEKVVQPMIGRNASLAPSFTPNGHSLKEGFYHGIALALSRSHGDNRLRSSTSNKGRLCPLADLFNGVPEGHPAVNIALHRGKWPFLRGGRYRNDCDLNCTAVALTRDVEVGEELIYSYGDASTTGFCLKFGAVPLPLTWVNPNEEAEIVITAEAILPNEFNKGKDGEGGFAEITKSLREKALRLCGFEIGDSLLLTEAELSAGQKGDGDEEEDEEEEGGALSALRTLCMLCVGSPAFLKAVLKADVPETSASHLARHGGFFMEEKLLEMTTEDIRPDKKILGAQLIHVIDMNMLRLSNAPTAADVARTKDGGVASPLEVVARQCRRRQREQLSRWRDRFGVEYGLWTKEAKANAEAAVKAKAKQVEEEAERERAMTEAIARAGLAARMQSAEAEEVPSGPMAAVQIS